MTYTVDISRDPSSGAWLADVRDLQAAHAFADDRQQLDVRVREVIALVEDLPDGAEETLHIVYVSVPAVLDQLNAYTGDNIWQDVIAHLDYDEAATEAIDPSDASDRFVLDGRIIRCNGDTWYDAGEYPAQGE
ncbi:hypothetical protein [Plantactinospora sp. CA-290183]|uniref:hypothetical protein n=1 Tax=Plantactinospora sp. CA-290183 TaxID=3240006 RepID=UPI003D8A6BC5